MQGNQAEQSIVDALDRIYQYEDFFDLVVIIRGGGSQVDLSCFDNYNVAYHVTQFPLPVLTGIGHEKDDSIVDMVAHTRLKTPTAVAEFILNGVAAFEERLTLLENEAVEMIGNVLDEEKQRLDQLAGDASMQVRNMLSDERSRLMQLSWKFRQETRLALQEGENYLEKKIQKTDFLINHFLFVQRQRITRAENLLDVAIPRSLITKKHQLDVYVLGFKKMIQKQLYDLKYRIDLVAQKGEMSDPRNILKKGYSITTYRGKLIRDISILENGEMITTKIYKGYINSKIIETKKSDSDDN
jgi:exodeoxyribonuclease VII large subunit